MKNYQQFEYETSRSKAVFATDIREIISSFSLQPSSFPAYSRIKQRQKNLEGAVYFFRQIENPISNQLPSSMIIALVRSHGVRTHDFPSQERRSAYPNRIATLVRLHDEMFSSMVLFCRERGGCLWRVACKQLFEFRIPNSGFQPPNQPDEMFAIA